MSDTLFANLPKSSTYKRVYGSGVNKYHLDKSNPLAVRSEDMFKKKSYGKPLPLRPVNVLDFPPHPSRDYGLLYDYYFPESAADHRTLNVAEKSFLRTRREENQTKRTQRNMGELGVGEDTSTARSFSGSKSSSRNVSGKSSTGTSKSSSKNTPPSELNLTPDTLNDPALSTISSSTIPFRSLSESPETRRRKKEWEEMTAGQKDLYTEYIQPDGNDWRNAIRDKVWRGALERIDERVKANVEGRHVLEVVNTARMNEEERMRELTAAQEEKEAHEKIHVANRMTPTQVRKMAVMATKEWRRCDRAKREKERLAKQQKQARQHRTPPQSEDGGGGGEIGTGSGSENGSVNENNDKIEEEEEKEEEEKYERKREGE